MKKMFCPIQDMPQNDIIVIIVPKTDILVFGKNVLPF